MAFRMQASVPELSELKNEPKTSTDLYGPDALKDGTFANCALLARRLAERGVRFVQIFHRGWDTHGDLPRDLASQCKDIDQACWGLIQDLKQRGMLEDTLVVWGGEFGRTAYCQGGLTATNYGRDHHPRCFTLWMAGGGVKPGYV
ncbi:MAG TPA: sulfatase, partial [Opitutae bacterium]|nr:sulfatase [Opitutae bacterium]